MLPPGATTIARTAPPNHKLLSPHRRLTPSEVYTMATNAPENVPQPAPANEASVEESEQAPTQNGDSETLPDAIAPPPEPKVQTRKDMSLREFLTKMDDYAPIVSPLQSLRPMETRL